MQPFPKVRVCVPSGSAAAQTLAHGEKRALKSSQVGELPGTCPAIHPGCELEHVPSPRCACGNAGGEGVSVTKCASPTSAEKSIPLPILYEKYCDYLTESNLIKVQGLLVQQADNKYLLAERDIYLENPEIKIRVSGGRGRAGGWAGSRGQGRVPGPAQGWERASLMHLHPCTLKLFDTSGILQFRLHPRTASWSQNNLGLMSES